MAARYIRYDRAWRKGFRHDPSLDLVAPASAPHRALSLRSVDYIPDHRCEPLCARRATCGRPARRLQRGERRPLTFEHGNQTLFDISKEGLSVHGSLDNHGATIPV
jgi:hypothetical protein